ncbi:Hym1p [Basidiobolus ranarum]|uniref:Hym1p n=1 Tax=Basidiobolus ranarum TaxID=34480 RepID=A0ABR2X298_9FUNG
MNIFFKSKTKSPHEIVRTLKDALQRLDTADWKRATEDVSKNLLAMKNILYGEGDQEPNSELITQLSQEVYSNDILYLLILKILKLEFEAKKDVAQVFNNLLRRQIGSRQPTIEHLCQKEKIIFMLFEGYENHDIALNCGMILRECIKYEPLAKILLLSPHFFKFFEYVEIGTFDVASDAFATFKELLTRHKQLMAPFLESNYDTFFDNYSKLLNSENYITQRQSLKLLSEILLDRSNFNVMTKYISYPENLKLMMNLLRNPSKNIQFEAFHVFKVFVANPNKTQPIAEILKKNRDKLVIFLTNFQNQRQDDEQFNDEKTFLLKQIQDLRV